MGFDACEPRGGGPRKEGPGGGEAGRPTPLGWGGGTQGGAGPGASRAPESGRGRCPDTQTPAGGAGAAGGFPEQQRPGREPGVRPEQRLPSTREHPCPALPWSPSGPPRGRASSGGPTSHFLPGSLQAKQRQSALSRVLRGKSARFASPCPPPCFSPPRQRPPPSPAPVLAVRPPSSACSQVGFLPAVTPSSVTPALPPPCLANALSPAQETPCNTAGPPR